MIECEQLERWLDRREDEHCEFKEARNQFDSKDLTDYCVALANERGGHLILGVTDARPRQIVGTRACPNLEQVQTQLLQRIHIRVHATELEIEGLRVVVFQIPGRPLGAPLQYDGRYLMRCGEFVVPKTPDQLQSIFAELQPDFTAVVCSEAKLSDLDPESIETLRALWVERGHPELAQTSRERLLEDLELLDRLGRVTNAALILLGTEQGIRHFLPQAELIFEYRGSDASIPAQQRFEFRQGYLGYIDKLWRMIQLRNERQQVRDGLFIREIQDFHEEVVREALLNAICHRDYRLGESILVRQFPKRLEIESPGGFPPGITPENILHHQFRRNRLVAEVLQKCGLIERSGQGADKMFRLMIEESKRRPDYSASDDYRVLLKLDAEIQDVNFLRFLEKVGQARRSSWTVDDLVLLDDIRLGKIHSADDRVRRLMEQGVVERVSRGAGTRYILSKQFHAFTGRRGAYTRSRGLDRETNKALILSHIRQHGKVTIREFEEVLPHLNRNQIHGLLKELKMARVRFVGVRTGHYEIVPDDASDH